MDTVISVYEARTLLGLSTTYNDTLGLLIPIIEEHIKSVCKTDFVDGFPDGLRLGALQMIKYHLSHQDQTLKSEKVGNYSVTYNQDYPESIIKLLRPYVKLKFV